MKYTAKSPANIALVKHWGIQDGKMLTPSISFNKSHCFTVTTVQLVPKKGISFEIFDASAQKIVISATENPPKGVTNIVNTFLEQHKEELQQKGVKGVKIMSENNFPASSGMASSASGFSALAYALLGAILPQKTPQLARLLPLCAKGGSFSALRSFTGPFCVLKPDFSVEKLEIAPNFTLLDITVVINTEKKKVSSQNGHVLANTSPFNASRVQETKNHSKLVQQALKNGNFSALKPLIRQQSMLMHAVMLTSTPFLNYFTPETWHIIQIIEKLMQNGHDVSWTLDAGANVHIITLEKEKNTVLQAIKEEKCIKNVFINKPCNGTHCINTHLF